MTERLVDSFGRVHTDLRISVTDRCNFRCSYCMPAEGMQWIPREEILTFEEIERVATVAVDRFGVDTIRLTGGEPTVRARLPVLIDKLARLEVDLALTTNGASLENMAHDLAAAGLRRINVSLDSLKADRFAELTRRDLLERVLGGIDAALDAGLEPVKLNVVTMRGVNDDELLDFATYGRERGVEVRFIEFMPLDAGEAWDREMVVPAAEVLETISAVHPLEKVDRGNEPAERFRYRDGAGTIGLIGSVTDPFCASCNRIRMTAEGQMRNCLFAVEEVDLRGLLRSGAGDDEIARVMSGCVSAKWAGHRIGEVQFIRPARSMSQIGG
ncbi:MAG: GTP 3',8-cyclase [Acidimicrobiales bacterium]|nr:GTP 3',8-cyclase [Acidimicrobiales bacterium]